MEGRLFFLRFDIYGIELPGEIENHNINFVPREWDALFGSGEDGPMLVSVNFNNWKEVQLCAQLGTICMDPLHPVTPISAPEIWIFRFYHPFCCPESVAYQSYYVQRGMTLDPHQ